MGYATTTEAITTERAEQLRAEPQERRLHFGVRTFEEKLISEAVSVWRDEEAGRHDDERVGSVQMHKPVAAQCRHLDLDGWSTECAHVVPVVAPESVSTVTKKVKVVIPGDVADKLRASHHWDALDAVRQILSAQFPVGVLGKIEVISVPAPRKPAARATEGKAVTRYKIRPSEHVVSRDKAVHAALNASYSSQAEARSVALDLLTENDTFPEMTVEAVVGRVTDSGEFSPALVTIARPTPAEATITVNITTHTVKPNPKIDRYEVTFWFHH